MVMSRQDTPSSLRVITLNIFGQQGSWPDRRQVLTDGLAELNPDLVAFQDTIVDNDYDQVGDLIDPEYHVVHQSNRASDGSGVSIASRWPIEDVRQLDLQVTPRAKDFPCTALVAEIRMPPPIGTLFLINKRTSWQYGFELERELEAVAAARFVQKLIGRRSAHVILASDLNATPDAASIRFLTGRQSLNGTSVCYLDTWERMHPEEPGHTFSPSNPRVAKGEMPLESGRRIDYIMVGCEDHGPTIRVSSCRRVFDEPVNGVWASDHFGVMAEFGQWS